MAQVDDDEVLFEMRQAMFRGDASVDDYIKAIAYAMYDLLYQLKEIGHLSIVNKWKFKEKKDDKLLE